MSAICLHTFRNLPWSATKTNMNENSYWHIKATLSNMKNMLVFWKTCHLWLRARVTKMSDFSRVLNYTIIQIGELSITIQQAQRKYWKNHITLRCIHLSRKMNYRHNYPITFTWQKKYSCLYFYIHNMMKVYFDATLNKDI